MKSQSGSREADSPGFDLGGVLLDRPSGVTCPVCRSELVIGQLESCQFAGCRACGGMLLQQNVFAMLIQHLRATSTLPPVTPQPLDPDELRVRRVCPSCQGVMETHAYAGPGNAVVDTCVSCSVIWFDRGEFSKLVRAPGKR